jgi:transposase
MTGSFERIEVITGVARWRRWSVDEKRRIVAESLVAGLSVSAVARRHGLGANQLFKWRKLAREGGFGLAGAPVPSFAPVHLVSGSAAGGWPLAGSAETGPAGVSASPVEIILANGCRLRVAADIEAWALHRLVTTVKAAGG